MAEPLTRVQTLAQTNPSQVPPQYIQHPQNRPTKASPSAPDRPSIPVIDVLEFDPTRIRSAAVHRDIARACSHWGAFQVINHRVPTPLLETMRRAALSFFNDTTPPERAAYACDPGSFASEGYGSRMLVAGSGGYDVLDWRDYFDHHTLPLSRRDSSRWPHFPPGYRDTVARYSESMNCLAMQLLGLVSESLGLPPSRMEEAVGEVYQNITVSYYPPCPQPELTLGLQAHSDMGAITLLLQDEVAGLEVFKDGDWVTAQPLSDAIVVILADQTEIITNGAYKSAQHRAITNADRARLSVATFHDPAKTMKICPASELISEQSPSRYHEVIYGEYVSSWYTKGPEGKRNLDALLL